MPEEILMIILVSIFAGTSISIIRMVLGYRERRGTAPGSSLTTSELEKMMRRAVEQATAPLVQKLVEKMEDLELEMATKQEVRQLHEARTDLLLDVNSDELEATAEPVSRKSRTRT